MALQKDGMFKGKKGNYWRIIALHANTLYNQTIARIALYENKDEREKDEANYISVIPLALVGVDYDRAKAYVALRGNGMFDEAVDC